jgi:hypothetical protein
MMALTTGFIYAELLLYNVCLCTIFFLADSLTMPLGNTSGYTVQSLMTLLVFNVFYLVIHAILKVFARSEISNAIERCEHLQLLESKSEGVIVLKGDLRDLESTEVLFSNKIVKELLPGGETTDPISLECLKSFKLLGLQTE